METLERIEELKCPQEDDSDQPFVIIQDDLKKKVTNDARIQARFKRSRHTNKSINVIGQDYNEPPKRTVRANGNIYHIIKPNNFGDIQNLHPDQSVMDMTLHELKFLTSTCWNERYQTLTIDMAKDENKNHYRLGLKSLFIPHSSPF